MNLYTAKKNKSLSSQNIYEGIYIPQSFEREVITHVLNNSINIDGLSQPIILSIEGKMGEGKTLLTEKSLKKNHIEYIKISGSLLAGYQEGASVQAFDYYYNQAKSLIKNGQYAAFIIDDFHLSIAATLKNASHTTNAENLVGHIMNVAENKNQIKVPIILIGNNFKNLYGPLTRYGRMTFFEWKPNLQDKKHIVRQIARYYHFNQSMIKDKEIDKFVEYYQDQYIAFFRQVFELIYKNRFLGIVDYFIENNGLIPKNKLAQYYQDVLNHTFLSLDLLYDYAKELINNKPQAYDEEDYSYE